MNINIYELREELNKIFDAKAEEFFDKLYGKGINKIVHAPGETMTMKEVQEFFGISRTTLNEWVKRRKIISEKKGNHRIFSRNFIENYKRERFMIYGSR
jgi:excisionase family DNA binding protein